MIRFECDYTEGAHPNVLDLLVRTNSDRTPGYGTDAYCEKARALIRDLCQNPRADVHFLTGGTQTNATVIASILRPHQGVLCAETAHIQTHETGAVEASGHRVLPLPCPHGKVTAGQIEDAYNRHWNDVVHEHTVQPGMVYISNPTETGLIYSKEELSSLSRVCRERKLPLFLDGARLGYGLAAQSNDLSLADIAALCDVFFIGGTKVGTLFGEAVVITNPELGRDFRYIVKQRGALLAKGRLLGVQFIALLENGLYFDISAHAVGLAMRLRKAFEEKGYAFLYPSDTNQQFPIIPDAHLAVLAKNYTFSFWEKTDEKNTAVRFCTSWATSEEEVDSLIRDLRAL